MADFTGCGVEAEKQTLGGGPKPPGLYDLVLITDEVKQYEDKPTMMWFADFQIVKGPHAGTVYKHSVNLTKGNGEKNEGGWKHLSNLWAACGQSGPLGSTDLIKGKPFTGHLIVQDGNQINPSTGKPWKENEMINHFKLGTAPNIPTETEVAEAEEPAPGPGGQQKMPWG